MIESGSEERNFSIGAEYHARGARLLGEKFTWACSSKTPDASGRTPAGFLGNSHRSRVLNTNWKTRASLSTLELFAMPLKVGHGFMIWPRLLNEIKCGRQAMQDRWSKWRWSSCCATLWSVDRHRWAIGRGLRVSSCSWRRSASANGVKGAVDVKPGAYRQNLRVDLSQKAMLQGKRLLLGVLHVGMGSEAPLLRASEVPRGKGPKSGVMPNAA